MIADIFTIKYFFDVIFVAISFFTFIKLISNDVYISRHRILPTICGIIVIYHFYIVSMPFMRTISTELYMSMLCDACALVIMYMMFFYFLFIKNPRHVGVIITVATALMIGMCVYDFVLFSLDAPKNIDADLLAVIFVFFTSVLVSLYAPSANYFDRTDKIISRYMLLAFLIAIIGYIGQDFIPAYDGVRSLAFALDCIIFFWLASTNRIEDTSTILKSTIFDRMEYPIGLVNAEFYLIEVNSKSIELFPEGIGVEFAFANKDFRDKFLLVEQMVKEGRNDSEYFAADRWYRVHLSPVEEDNQVKGYIISAFDITDQHSATSKAKMETAQKSQFLAHMSHELRSPLHAIMGVSDILVTKKDISEKNKNLISHIKRASENLLELVNAILDYSKLEAGKFEFTEKKYDVTAALEDLAYATLLNIQSKPIDFNLAVTNKYPKYLYGDPIRFREIFQNILSNAVKFTEKGSIHAELSLELEGDRYKINFSISDTGQGMTTEQIDEIFGEYVSTSSQSDLEGTGLGLSITKQLIKKLDGSIKAYSDGIKGSVFSGYFYQKQCTVEMMEERVLNRRTLMTQNFHGFVDQLDTIYPEAKVLVADDMRINLEIIKQMLNQWKCQVVTVPDGASAVQAIRESHFDLVLLDQMMMPLSGPEACRQIKKISSVPVILVTANSEDNAVNIAKEYGFDDFLGKPILGASLKEIIEKYLPKNLAVDNLDSDVISLISRNRQTNNAYHKTLESFVREMQPLLLNLPNYRNSDQDMFIVKVHGIAGVSRQLGRENFAKEAQIMEMAAKSNTWSYVDEHLDDFLNSFCEVVDEATKELTQLAPNEEIDDSVDKINLEKNKSMDLEHILEDLRKAFDKYDLNAIEKALEKLDLYKKDQALTDLYAGLKNAYDNFEYEEGLQLVNSFEND